MKWLLEEDPANLPVRDYDKFRLRERYIMTVLYQATNGPEWNRSDNFLTNSSVCEWMGVNCGNEDYIVSLDFSKWTNTFFLLGAYEMCFG